MDRAVYATNDLDTVKYAYRADATPTAAELNNVANWQTERLLSSPEGDNDETALSSGPSGIFLTYKWFVPNDNRLGLRRFDPVTNTFGGPVYVESADQIDNNSLDYPYHSQDGSGRLHVVWRTLHDDGRLRYTRSDDGGVTFSAAANLAIKETFIDPIVEAAPSRAGFAAWKGIGSGSAIRVVAIDPQPEPAAPGGGGPGPGGGGLDTTPPSAGSFTMGDPTLLPGQGTRFSFNSSEAGQGRADPLPRAAQTPFLARPATMHAVPVIALIDGEHHPSAVRDALAGLDLAGVVFCGGEEKLGPGPLEEHYGMPVETQPDGALRRLAPYADTVLDLADEPIVPASAKLRLAALALSLGLAYETPGARLDPPRYETVPFTGPKLAVIGTGKRTGKTALAGHWAALLRDQGADPVIVCMGRGGPAEPRVAQAAPSLDELIAIAEAGSHAASDFLEDAVTAGVRTVGCRRVGGGFAGEPFDSNVAAGAALAASLDPGTILFEGSGACIPPVEVDRTACILGAGPAEPFAEYRLARADLVLAAEGAPDPPPGAVPFTLRSEPLEPIPAGARVAVFTTGATEVEGIPDPVLVSTNLARRSALAAELDRAAAERCDVYLTELKAAAIDTVAMRARAEGARVVFIRNRPVGVDDALVKLYRDA